jgi:hypothetical protein
MTTCAGCGEDKGYVCYVLTEFGYGVDEYEGWCTECFGVCSYCQEDKDLTHRNGTIVCKDCLTKCSCCIGDRPANLIQIGQHEWRCEDCITEQEQKDRIREKLKSWCPIEYKKAFMRQEEGATRDELNAEFPELMALYKGL